MISSIAWLIISLLSYCLLNFFSVFVSFPRSLVGLFLEYSKPKSQGLTSVWWIPRATDETSLFRYILCMIYIPFTVLYRDITHLGLSIWWGVLSSNFPAVVSAVGICPIRFSIRRFYNYFINKFCYLRAFKHVYSYFKINLFTIRSLHIFLLSPAVGHAV